MKTIKYLLIAIGLMAGQARAQTQDIQQLLLDIEKLTQLKSILSDMKTGYEIVSGGYNQVKQLASGNFSLHQGFLDGLLLISPQVRNYGRVADILIAQAAIVSEYRSAYRRFNGGGNFEVTELDYMGKVYGALTSASLQNLDQLTMVLTANKLRMSDEERLRAIDRIAADTDDKLAFLRQFNRNSSLLALQRQHERTQISSIQKLY
jgi:hypothetical protein